MVKMELIKTEQKQCSANVYEVHYDGEKIGFVYRQYYKSAGAWAARYVGHWKGGFEWLLDLSYTPRKIREFKNCYESCKTFDTLKDLKEFLKKNDLL